MSLLKDLLVTAGDVLRLSSDLMQCKLEVQRRAVRRGVGRLAMCLAFCTAAFLLAVAGVGFILYGAFALIAPVLGPGAAGLLVGFAVLLMAGLLPLVGRGLTSRSSN